MAQMDFCQLSNYWLVTSRTVLLRFLTVGLVIVTTSCNSHVTTVVCTKTGCTTQPYPASVRAEREHESALERLNRRYMEQREATRRWLYLQI